MGQGTSPWILKCLSVTPDRVWKDVRHLRTHVDPRQSARKVCLHYRWTGMGSWFLDSYCRPTGWNRSNKGILPITRIRREVSPREGDMRTGGQVIRALTSAMAILAVLAGSVAPMLACPAHCGFELGRMVKHPVDSVFRGSRCACRKLMKRGSARAATATPRHTNDSLPCTCDVHPSKAITVSRGCKLRDGSTSTSDRIDEARSCMRTQTALILWRFCTMRTCWTADPSVALISRIQI